MTRLLFLCALTACVTEPDLGEATQEAGCAPSQCGNSNSPVIAGVLFWSLHPTPGTPNAQGVWIESVTSATGIPLALRTPFPGDRLSGVKLAGPPGTVDHLDLVGTKLNLRVNGKPFRVTIESVTPSWALVPLWVDPTPRLEMYEFSYVPLSNGVPTTSIGTPLCTTEDNDPTHPMIRAAVFGRDIYDPATKAVTFDPSPAGWFNIACEGGAPWKMEMIGYTQAVANQIAGITTTSDDRQAMLRAWTADVCGTGKAFTKHGEQITLSERHGYLPKSSPYIQKTAITLEAMWGPKGALCLDVPRLADTDSTIRSKIAAECTLPPPCTPLPSGVVLTGNPAGS